MTAQKQVYSFANGRAEGTGEMRDLLGGKGAGLVEMTRIGLPVPAGFVITTEACALFLRHGRGRLQPLQAEVRRHLKRLEAASGRRFGAAAFVR